MSQADGFRWVGSVPVDGFGVGPDGSPASLQAFTGGRRTVRAVRREGCQSRREHVELHNNASRRRKVQENLGNLRACAGGCHGHRGQYITSEFNCDACLPNLSLLLAPLPFLEMPGTVLDGREPRQQGTSGRRTSKDVCSNVDEGTSLARLARAGRGLAFLLVPGGVG